MSDITPQDVVNPAAGFPFAFVDAIIETLQYWIPQAQVVPRQPRITDSAFVIGVYPATWVEKPDAKEIGRPEGVINTYTIKIRVMRKSMDEAMGRALFSNDSKLVRVILYRDPSLEVRLGGLQEVLLGSTETVQKFGVVRQEFESADMTGSFIFLATTDYFVETTTS